MPVLIDGNNLLFAARDVDDPERPLARSGLCEWLRRWSIRSGERVTVVFDGPMPSASLARQIAGDGIDVVYSGAGVKADDVIALMHHDPPPVVLKVAL